MIEHSYNFVTGETDDYSALLQDGKLLPRRVFLDDQEQYFARVVSCRTGVNGQVVVKDFLGGLTEAGHVINDPWSGEEITKEGRVRVEPWALQMCNWEHPLHETPELVIYFLIETLGAFLHMQRRLKRRGEMSLDTGVRDEISAYLDQQLMVAMLRLRDGLQFADHAEYMKWYRWWSEWHRNTLSEEQWGQLNKLIGTCRTEDDFKGWRPPGSWK